MLSFYKPQDKNDLKPAPVAPYHFSVTNTDFMTMQVPFKMSSLLLSEATVPADTFWQKTMLLCRGFQQRRGSALDQG